MQVGGIVNFPITKELLESVKASRSKYSEELRAKKSLSAERERNSREQGVEWNCRTNVEFGNWHRSG